MVLALHNPSFTTKLTPAHYLKEIIRVKKISSTSNHLVETFTNTVSNDHYETLPPTPPFERRYRLPPTRFFERRSNAPPLSPLPL